MMVKRDVHRHDKTSGQDRPVRPAFTVVEVMVSILAIMILATGALGYQFMSTRDVKIAEVQANAARMSLLFLESWKGENGVTDFDPVSVFADEMDIQTATCGPAIPTDSGGTDLTWLGYYEVRFNNVCYYVTLSYNPESESEPMLLSSVICWRRDFQQGELDGEEKTVQNATYLVAY